MNNVSRETPPPVVRISPSAIDTWRTCQRKWAYRYIARLETPGNASAQLGNLCHAALEAHEKGERAIDTSPHPSGPTVGQIAAQGLEYVPPQIVMVEGRFSLRCDVYGNIDPAGEVELNGLIDLVGAYGEEPFIQDWKTTKDFRYAKTADVLMRDPQAIIYAAAWESATGRDATAGRWVYLHTGLRGSRPVEFRISGRRALPMLSSDLRGIVHARRNWTVATDAPVNLSACRAYGGCPYLPACQQNIPIEALLAQGKFLKDHDRKLKEGPMSNTIDFNNVFSQVMGGVVPAAPPTIPATPFPGQAPYVPPQYVAPVPAPQVGAGLPSGVLAALQGAPAPEVPPLVHQIVTPPPGLLPPDPRAMAPAVQYPATTALPPPSQAHVPTAAPTAYAPAARKNGAGFLLYVNAIPIGRTVVYASALLERAGETLAAQGIQHYKLVDFGKGVAMLAQALEPILAQHDPATPIVLLLDGNAGRDALDTFLAHAGAVVRGV